MLMLDRHTVHVSSVLGGPTCVRRHGGAEGSPEARVSLSRRSDALHQHLKRGEVIHDGARVRECHRQPLGCKDKQYKRQERVGE